MPEKYCGHYGGVTKSDDPCMRPAAWGRNDDEGRCMYHYGDKSSIEEVSNGKRIPTNIDLPEDLSKPPKHLNETQTRIWNQVVAYLEKSGSWQDVYWIKLQDLCNTQAVIWELHEKLQKEGWTTYDANNDRNRKNPGFQIMRDMMSKANTLASEFGITPKEAQKMELIEESKQVDPMDQIISG